MTVSTDNSEKLAGDHGRPAEEELPSQVVRELLFEDLRPKQSEAVTCPARRLLVLAGAGSGKTEVMARRIAWWVAVNGVEKKRVVAFTFTERAAEEMKFRIRLWLQKVTPPDTEVSLGGMYVGTIHGYCLAKLREFWPDDYHNYDVLDEGARAALILRGFNGLLGLGTLRATLGLGQYATLEKFTQTYDQLHENDRFTVELPPGPPPYTLGDAEREWCRAGRLVTDVGRTDAASAFATSAARYYAYLRCRRFLDFSTSQSEFIRRTREDEMRRRLISDSGIHLVVDEVQDINPVQLELIQLLVGDTGRLTAVGDHRQSIYGFRGAKVRIVAELSRSFETSSDADVVALEENFRSTPRIIELSNSWAATIGAVESMATTPMKHGNGSRIDHHESHVALVGFDEREDEAAWIAEAIRILVPSEAEGAVHDKRDGSRRGLTLSDVAVMVRSSTSVRTYMQALEDAGIPAVVRAGPDLFSQPEVLLFVAALAISAGCGPFIGSHVNPKSLPNRVRAVLGCGPDPVSVLQAAAKALRQSGLTFDRNVESRLLLAAQALKQRIIDGKPSDHADVFHAPRLRHFLKSRNELRRVFPQQLYHMLLAEAEVHQWDTCIGRGQAVLFHLGALSRLITGIETPGWTSARDYPWQVIGLCQFGAEEGRTEEEPLMVQPDAVSITTIHAAKGLEFAVVFLADVNARRFPSAFARRSADLPSDGAIVQDIDVAGLADNANHDGERRLMYVALTRSERFLFITHSGDQTSKFIKELEQLVPASGGLATDDPASLLAELRYAPKEHRRDVRIATSFSDLRYYLECPHDFYLRKVLGFAPTIDQAFGYGRGVHNLMRAVHSAPKKWAALASDREALERELALLVERGLFYLRYTVGQPAANMRQKGIRVAADYVQRYSAELATLSFEPEKEFESLIEYEDGNGGALVSGAVDIVRQDDPPKVTIVDFKSGDPDSDRHQRLDEREMQLQVGLYALAMKRELEYEPEQGLVRYLDSGDRKSELQIPLDRQALIAAKRTVAETAMRIRDRRFASNPTSEPRDATNRIRCEECDFGDFCGMPAARSFRASRQGNAG